ncbi:MAG: restriction endonuclease subunit S [Bacteroidota bacterium]
MSKPYLQYKNSGIEWIGEIPEHWEIIRIKNIIESTTNGVWGKEPQGDENDVICIRVADFDRDFSSLSGNNTIRNVSKNDLETRTLAQGDLLIEKSGGGDLLPVGRVGIYERNNVTAVCSNFMARIRPNKNKVDPKWLYYLFRTTYSKKVNLGAIKQTTGIQNLDTYNYFINKVGLPYIDEQQTIATYLDHKTKEIDDTIAKKQRLIELLEEERKATINEAVTKGLNPNVKMKDSGIEWIGEIPEHWEVKKLKYLAPLIRNKNDDNKDIIGLENIEGGTGKLIPDSESNISGESYVFKKDDVLFNKLRPYLTKVYLAKDEGACVGELLILRPQKKINPLFVFYRLISSKFIEIVNNSTYGTKMPRANWDFIGNLKIALPDIREQNEIAKFISLNTDRINSSVKKIQEQIEYLKEYRQSLIFEAVTGKIDVREEV